MAQSSHSRLRNLPAAAVLLVFVTGASARPAESPSGSAAPTSERADGDGRPGRSYDLTSEAPGTWSAVDQAQGLRFLLSEQGLRASPLEESDIPWDWGLRLEAYGPANDLRRADAFHAEVHGSRLELSHDRLIESFEYGPGGIEYSIEMSAALQPSLVLLRFAQSGTLIPKVERDGLSVTFSDARGGAVLACRGWRAEDTEGRDVAVRWERLEPGEFPGGDLRIVLQGDDHRYPIQIRGLITRARGDGRPDVAGPMNAATGREPVLAAPPFNDQCNGAEAIPGDGPFPYLSDTYDITDATTTGDPPSPSCQSNVSRSVWFRFMPELSGFYAFSLCSGGDTGTTVVDTVLAVYSSTGTCSGLQEVAGGCSDDGCVTGSQQSVISNFSLTGGTTYYIVAWQRGPNPPVPAEASIQLQVSQSTPPTPPPNDRCTGATVVPAAGPFPYLSPVTTNITDATTLADPPLPTCQNLVSRSIWYAFTPAASANYTFSVCADAPTGTTVDDTVMAIYSSTSACSGFSQVAGACDDDSCGLEDAQSVIGNVRLTAGTTYNVVVWKHDSAPPPPGNRAVQLRVTQTPVPANDTCAGAVSLPLNVSISGTTASASNQYQLPSGSACFAGLGQTATTAGGGEVVYSFTAPQAGSYSFRVAAYDTTRNAVLYVASDCPAGPFPATIAGCLGAANRSTNNPSEAVTCLGLSSGQTAFVFVDETAQTTGSAFTVEVNPCNLEAEPNGTPASAGLPVCGVEGSITPAADADFYSLRTPAAGSRVFALVDGAASNSTDYDLRITTDTDTLEYDDDNSDIPLGASSADIAGTPLTGAASYLRVNRRLDSLIAEPYRLYAAIEPPMGTATPEVEPNGSVFNATLGPNFYFSGSLGSLSDVDVFEFTSQSGDLITVWLDTDPLRDNTPFNGSLALLDAFGATLAMVNDAAVTSSTVPGTGSLGAVTPFSPAEALTYRVKIGGDIYARVGYSSGSIGDYLLAITRNCRVGPPTDLSVTQTDSPDPVPPGGAITYAVSVANLGSTPASLVTLRDDLPLGGTLVSAIPSQGSCTTSATAVCDLGAISGGGVATVSITVTAPSSPGSIAHSVQVGAEVIDTNPANDSSAEATMVSSTDGDGDGVPDASDCAPADPGAWSIPGDVADLVFPGPDPTLVQWGPPPVPGGTTVHYDLLRSTAKDDFMAATCVSTDLSGTTTSDPALPGVVFYYLLRSENVCGGNLGVRSDGTPRTGRSCP